MDKQSIHWSNGEKSLILWQLIKCRKITALKATAIPYSIWNKFTATKKMNKGFKKYEAEVVRLILSNRFKGFSWQTNSGNYKFSSIVWEANKQLYYYYTFINPYMTYKKKITIKFIDDAKMTDSMRRPGPDKTRRFNII